MTARTAPRAGGAPHKPQNPQKAGATAPDQSRSPSQAPDGRAPQKPAKSPHKYRTATCGHPGHPAAADLCGGSHRFCGIQPHRPDTAGQPASSHVSADSAISAAGVPAHRTEGSSVTPAPSIEVLTVPEVMATLRMSRPKVYDLIRSGKLLSFTEGRSRRVPFDAVATYIRNKTEEAA